MEAKETIAMGEDGLTWFFRARCDSDGLLKKTRMPCSCVNFKEMCRCGNVG